MFAARGDFGEATKTTKTTFRFAGFVFVCFLLLFLALLLLLKSEDLVAVASRVACSPLLLNCVGVAPLMVA